MITGTHAIVYATDAAKARTFFRDVLAMPNIDVHDGWLIAGGYFPRDLGNNSNGIARWVK